MTTKKQIDDNLVPRVSVLERGQEAIQRDLISLSHAVKDQGLQLTNALTTLTEAHHQSFNVIQEKISSGSKTDWQTFWTMGGTVLIVIAGIMSPVWMQFSQVEKNFNSTNETIQRMQDIQTENYKNIGIILDRENRNEENINSGKRS